MEIRFQPALLQEVVDSFSEKTEREGDPTYYNEFHEFADPIYEKFSLDEREPEFKKLYQHLFAKWGFADILRDSFEEFPELKAKIGWSLFEVCSKKIRKVWIFFGSGGRLRKS